MEFMDSNIPENIKAKLMAVFEECESIINSAYEIVGGYDLLDVGISIRHSAPGDVLTKEERYQHACLVARFYDLPELEGNLVEERQGNYYLSSLFPLRHILNEYRMILFNQNDSIYYKKLHTFCYKALNNQDPTKGLSITITKVNGINVTEKFMKFLSSNTKAIELVILNCELDYLYNGILQHSDDRFTDRYLEEYVSGKLNYVLLKNAILVNECKNFISVYYRIFNCLTFPLLGPL